MNEIEQEREMEETDPDFAESQRLRFERLEAEVRANTEEQKKRIVPNVKLSVKVAHWMKMILMMTTTTMTMMAWKLSTHLSGDGNSFKRLAGLTFFIN